jgi:NADH:ubiquinone oxidoreductase subunit H
VLAIHQELVTAELDLLLWWLVSAMTITLATLFSALAQGQSRPKESLLRAVQAGIHQIPLLVLGISVIVVTRTSRLGDIVRSQGGWPQNWLIFHDPALALIALVAAAALVPSSVPGGRILSAVPSATKLGLREEESAGGSLLAFVANRLYLWIQALLLSNLVLGGWSMPGLASSASDNQLSYKLVAVGILLLKTWAVIAVISTIRSSVGFPGLRHTAHWLSRRALPVSLAACAITCAWTWALRYWAIVWADAVMHWVVLWLLVAAVTWLVFRVAERLRNGSPLAAAKPWL